MSAEQGSRSPEAGDAFDARAQPRVVGTLARWLLRIFFRDIEVVDADRVPRTGGLMYAANHVNALVDPALLMATMPRGPRFLAKSTLWKMAILRPFLQLAAAIPVYRRQDAGVDTSRNAEMFAQCHAVLRAGGVIAIFPEGTSHNEPALVPLKTGISRIVLEAAAGDDGAVGETMRIVPVGLTFEDKATFRSRALVKVGEAIDPGVELAAYADDPQAAVRSLTERVRSGLGDVTLNYPSWQEARRIERAAELFTRPSPALPSLLSLEARFAVRRAFIDGYQRLRAEQPARVAEVAEAVARYDEMLALYGLRDAQVAAQYPPGRVGRFLAKSLWLMAVRLPLAALGAVLNVVPYVLADAVARGQSGTPDVTATYKLLASMIFYPVTWALWATGVGWFAGGLVGAAVFCLAPLSGYVALRFLERRDHLWRETRAFLLLRSGKRSVEALRARRHEVLIAVQALAAEVAPDQASERTASARSTSSAQ